MLTLLLLCCITLIAAVQDARTGTIANALTLPPLVAAPLVFGVLHGPFAGGMSVLSLMVCGAIPFWMFCKGAAGGGDVKLYAAIGAIGGFDFGLTVLCLSLLVATCASLARLTYQGGLGRTLNNVLQLVLNIFRSRSKRKALKANQVSTIRMGIPIFIATLLTLLWG